MSDADPIARVRDQVKTALPEDPIVVRVYTHPEKSPAELEALFHKMLKSSFHDRTERGGGREWYVTTPEFTDTFADAIGCDITTPTPDKGN